MSTQVQNVSSSKEKTRRDRRPPIEDSEFPSVSKKRTKPNHEADQNPYESIPEIPHVNLTIQQMKSDPIELLLKLEELYAQFGGVKLTCCEEWNSPFTFRYVDKGITTRIQKLQSLKQGKAYPQAFQQNVQAYNIKSFQTFAQNFQHSYKFKTSPEGESIQGKKQLQYWRLVTSSEYSNKEVRVEYAADLPSIRYGSGFPTTKSYNWKDSDFVYEENLFNLNNLMKSPSSLLKMAQKRKQKISGITHPWVYMGMQFSSFCWHVEDLWVNSLNYNHKGGIKTWYFIPGSYKEKFDKYIKDKYCQTTFKKTLLQRLTFMVDPLELIDAGIPVYKTYQRPRDYVCTFFKAYHCGFSQGFNVGEAVNFLGIESLATMFDARLAKKQDPKPSPNVFPIQWLILQNYKAINSFKSSQQKLRKYYEEMISKEKEELKEIARICEIQEVHLIPQKLKYDKIMCSQCKEYLYLEAYKCNGKNYCFEHIRQLTQKDSENNKGKQEKIKIQLHFRKQTESRDELLKLLPVAPIEDQEETKKSQ